MVDVSLIISGGGVGDLQDFMFTVDDANQQTLLIISAHEGQSDSISSITLDGNAVTSNIVNGGDSTTGHIVYQLSQTSAGSHDLTITTGGGTYRYGYTLLKVLGWTGQSVVSQNTGTGTTATLSLETRTADMVLSFLTADTNVVATSADTELQSGTAGSGALRVRFATSYEQAGNISWTLGSSQAWALSIILLRGTAFYTGTPITTGSPIYVNTPIRTGTPGSVGLNL